MFLREQWAGLFQALLKEQARQREINILEDMKATVKMLNELVTFLTEDKKKSSEAVRQIILSNHPIFEQMRRLTGVAYRVYFTNYQEMASWLRARRYEQRESSWGTVEEWVCRDEKSQKIMEINKCLFDDNGKPKVFTSDEWESDWVNQYEEEVSVNLDDEIPF